MLFTVKHFRACGRLLIDLVFPIECLGCGSEGAWLCGRCIARLPVRIQTCPDCGRPSANGVCCPACRPDRILDGVFALLPYDHAVVTALIKHLKYASADEIATILAGTLASPLLNAVGPLAGLLASDPVVLAVPLHSRRERQRGFNQSALIAAPLADSLGLILPNGLVRTRATEPQATLKGERRHTNVADAFLWIGTPLGGRPVLLVDDVYTTGATMRNCARALKKGGAGVIWGVAVAGG